MDEIEIFDLATTHGERWKEFLAARDRGERLQIDLEMFDYWLNVLPPQFMGRLVRLADGQECYADFGFAEGLEPVIAFFSSPGRNPSRFYCQRTARMFGRG